MRMDPRLAELINHVASFWDSAVGGAPRGR